MFLSWTVALAVLGSDPPPPSPSSPPLAFVYVESNVNGASGGHLALRVDGHVYHYQQRPGPVLCLTRDPWVVFRHSYAGLQNRNLHLTYLDVRADTVSRLADHFSARFTEQASARDRLHRAREDRAWWEALAAEAELPALRGCGLLDRSGVATDAGQRLRRRVAERHGAAFLEHALERCEEALARAADTPGSIDLERVRERLQEREALLALQRASGLTANSTLPEELWPPLSAAELVSLAAFQQHLEDALLERLRSPRPDRGLTLLRSLARYYAIEQSLAHGRLVLLDVFPDDAERVAVADDREQPALDANVRQGHELVDWVRAQVLDGGLPVEDDLQRLEECASRCQEFHRARTTHEIRLAEGRLLPDRGAVPRWRPVRADGLAHAREEQAQAEAAWLDGRGYDLLARNCVTELVTQVNAALGPDDQVRAILGDCLRPGKGLEFIPFILHDHIQSRLTVARRETIPARRLRELQRIRDDDDPWNDWAERTTLWSDIYTPRQDDGAFLLFTDDVLWRRPLFGAANLVYAVGQSAVGLPAALFDDGRRLRAGLNGVLFSVPELFFGNIRKGTFGHVPVGQ